MTDLNLNNLKMDFKYIENSETVWNPNGVKGCDEESFIRSNPQAGKVFSRNLILTKTNIFRNRNLPVQRTWPVMMVF